MNIRKMTLISIACAGLAALVGTAAARADEVKAGDLVISQGWTRATPNGAKIGGGYLTIENKGSAPDRLIGGSADVLHLAAASAWIGGLAGLCVLFAVGRHRPAREWGPLQFDAIRRFSIIGMISVAVLIASGIVHVWILVGSVRALLATDYGRLLLLKLAAFAIMIGFAAVNRLSLTPQLAVGAKDGARAPALAALRRNTLIEIALALAIFAIVAVLGTLHPAIHLVQ